MSGCFGEIVAFYIVLKISIVWNTVQRASNGNCSFHIFAVYTFTNIWNARYMYYLIYTTWRAAVLYRIQHGSEWLVKFKRLVKRLDENIRILEQFKV
jgi:hypothetical protein